MISGRARCGLLPLGAVLLSGCGGPSSAPTGPSGGTVARAVLAHVPHGEATLSFNPATRALTGSISVSGLVPDSGHPLHIHSGTCATPGRVLYEHLSPVFANPTGLATDRPFTVPRVAEGRIPATGWFIDLHNGPSLGSPEQSQTILCGDVSNPGSQTELTVPMLSGPPGTFDQSVTGSADLTLEGGLKVAIQLRGLTPHSAHVAQVHTGTCEAQARVLYPLDTLTADAHGDARGTTTVEGVTAMPSLPVYVVVRRSTAGSTQTDLDPIACGNVGTR